jgi:predicted phosphate transport protein (TIGR00153 family)
VDIGPGSPVGLPASYSPAVRFRLVPSDDGFFELFRASSDNAVECAQRLKELIDDFSDVDKKHNRVVDCERRGDEITGTILRRLSSTFVTPFDREDIHALAEELDDVVDDMLAVSYLLQLTGVGSLLPEVKEQADVMVKMAEEVTALMARLEKMKGVQPHLDAIDRLESEGDAVYRRTMARLFSGEYDALDVLKWKDIIEALEAALNTLEDIGDVVESIVLKHA